MYTITAPSRQITISKTEVILFLILVLWSGVWKIIALWKSSRHKQLGWFIALAIINTAGILEIIYLVYFQPKRKRYTK